MTENERRIESLENALQEAAVRIGRGNAGKIDAIRAYRVATGMPLKESKDFIESLTPVASVIAEEPGMARQLFLRACMEFRLASLAGDTDKAAVFLNVTNALEAAYPKETAAEAQ